MLSLQNDHLSEVVQFIIRTMEPERIFLAGKSSPDDGQEGVKIDLLILIPDNAHKCFTEFETFMELGSEQNAWLSFTLHKASEIYQHLTAGHIFYSRVCVAKNLIYDNGKTLLPDLISSRVAALKSKADQFFSAGVHKADSFLEGAGWYRSKKEYAMAAFMLQQTTELTLRALLLALTGFDLKTHLIRKLKKQCKRYTGALDTIFPDNTPYEQQLLNLLEKAYIEVRYGDHYEIEEPGLLMLFERVGRLHTTAKEVFRENIMIFENAIGSTFQAGSYPS